MFLSIQMLFIFFRIFNLYLGVYKTQLDETNEDTIAKIIIELDEKFTNSTRAIDHIKAHIKSYWHFYFKNVTHHTPT